MSKPLDIALLNRVLIGFDQLLSQNTQPNNYPPYNVIKYSECNYCIEVAVAGFTKSEISVQVDNEKLVVKGTNARLESNNAEYIHRGLASRNFEQIFTLAEYMEVVDAAINDGVLRIYIERVIPDLSNLTTIEIK